MVTIQIEMDDVQHKALACVALDPEEYIQNFVNVRCHKAIEEVSQKEVQRRLDAGEPIPQTKTDIIMSEDVLTLAEKQALEDQEPQV